MKTTIHEPLEFAVLGSGLGFTEGPVITADGDVLVVDIDGGRVLRLAGGGAEVVATPGGGPERDGTRDADARHSSPTTAASSGPK